MKINFYGLCNKQSGFLSNIFLGGDDKEASKWMLEQLTTSYHEIKNEEEQARFLVYVRDCNIVKIGDLDPVGHGMSEDFNVLVDLKDFEKEVNEQNGAAS